MPRPGAIPPPPTGGAIARARARFARFQHLEPDILDEQRRDFIALLGGAAVTWPLAARAQQPERMRRVGVLMQFAETDPQSMPRVTAFEEGLAKVGWTVARNLRIDAQGFVQSLAHPRRQHHRLLIFRADPGSKVQAVI
jgi:hypothetical protein